MAEYRAESLADISGMLTKLAENQERIANSAGTGRRAGATARSAAAAYRDAAGVLLATELVAPAPERPGRKDPEAALAAIAAGNAARLVLAAEGFSGDAEFAEFALRLIGVLRRRS